jgi:hypothetical protein
MWIIASLLFATVIILRFSKDELMLSQGLNAKIQTQMMAQDVFELLKFYVPTADYSSIALQNSLLENLPYTFPKEIIVDGRDYNLSNEIILSVKDTSGMVNITYGNAESIAELLTGQQDEVLKTILKSSLEDWRDEDNVAQNNGAEQSSYSSINSKVIVRDNLAIQDIHELSIIKGFNQVDFKKIEEDLYYGRGSMLNLMLINNSRYLAWLFKIDDSEANNLLELRAEDIKKFQKAVLKYPTYDDNSMGFHFSKQFVVTIIVKKKRAKSVLKSIISFKSLSDRPYLTISYILK